MSDALREHLGDATAFSQPEGGLLVWGRLRDGIDAAQVLPLAIECNVLFVPGSAFYSTPRKSSELPLSYATASTEEIREGVHRLADAVHALIR